jgi:hypothetical protein
VPGGRAGKRQCPLSFVVTVIGPPMSAGEVTRTTAPTRTASCSSLTVPKNAPVNPCAAVTKGKSTHAATKTDWQNLVLPMMSSLVG